MQQSGEWVQQYIGNKIVENNNQNGSGSQNGDSTTDDGGIFSPLRPTDQPGELKELISTERFLYEDDIKRNPYMFESDEFVKQKYLEKKQLAYQQVNITYNAAANE